MKLNHLRKFPGLQYSTLKRFAVWRRILECQRANVCEKHSASRACDRWKEWEIKECWCQEQKQNFRRSLHDNRFAFSWFACSAVLEWPFFLAKRRRSRQWKKRSVQWCACLCCVFCCCSSFFCVLGIPHNSLCVVGYVTLCYNLRQNELSSLFFLAVCCRCCPRSDSGEPRSVSHL